MGCEETKDLLALYAGGEVDAEERAPVEAHVAACAACARDLDGYREARVRLSALGEPDGERDGGLDVWCSVQEELFPWRRSPSRKRGQVVLKYAAIFIVGVALGLVAHAFTRLSESEPFAAPSVGVAQEPVRAGVRPVHGGSPSFRFDLPPLRSDDRNR